MKFLIKVSKNKINTVIVILIFTVNFFNINPQNKSYANPIYYWGEIYENGGIFVANQTNFNLTMSNANVVMNLDANDYRHKFHLSFDGNYTIYNPNSTASVWIGNPFQLGQEDYFDYYYDDSEWWVNYDPPNYIQLVNESLKVYVNEEEIEASLQILNSTFYEEWEDYFGDNFGPQVLVLSKILLKGYSSTRIRYTWNTTILTNDGSSWSNFYYIVGTGRCWSENVTETVSMNVYGKQPDFYSDAYNEVFYKECFISNIEGGKQYKWKWMNEEILDNAVGIHYNRVLFFEKYRSYFIILVPALTIIIVISLYYIIRKKLLERTTI